MKARELRDRLAVMREDDPVVLLVTQVPGAMGPWSGAVSAEIEHVDQKSVPGQGRVVILAGTFLRVEL